MSFTVPYLFSINPTHANALASSLSLSLSLSREREKILVDIKNPTKSIFVYLRCLTVKYSNPYRTCTLYDRVQYQAYGIFFNDHGRSVAGTRPPI